MRRRPRKRLGSRTLAGSSKAGKTSLPKPETKKEQPRFYGSGPVQHTMPGKKPRAVRTHRKRSVGPPPILYVGVGAVGLLFIAFVLALAGGSGDAPRPRKTAQPSPVSAPRDSVTATPAATVAPAAPDQEEEQPEARRPAAPSPDSELDNEETAEEARERLRLVDEMRAREAKALKELESKTNE